MLYKCYLDVPTPVTEGAETDQFAKTVSSRDAALEPARMHSRRVLANWSVSCTKPSHKPLGVAEWNRYVSLSSARALLEFCCSPTMAHTRERDKYMVTSPVLHSLVTAVFTLLNGGMLYLSLLQFPFSVEAFVASFKHWNQLSPRVGIVLFIAVAVIILAVLIKVRLSDPWKNRLLYFKLQCAHPAHQAFFGGRNPGFDLEPINRAYPQVRDSAWAPEVQFEIWEKLYRKHASARIVGGPEQTWRLLRDLYTLSVVFLVAFLIAWPLNVGIVFAIAAPYVFVFGGQTIFLLFSARGIGRQLVNNVLGAELGLGPQKEKQKTKHKRH